MTRRAISTINAVLLALLVWSCRGVDQKQTSPRRMGSYGPGALIIAYTADSADTFAAIGSDSTLILQWLRRACDSAGVKLEVKEFPFGTLVNGIGPRVNGDGGNWLYRVNGQMLPKAASACMVSPTDTVLFFFQ